jgi:xylulokinase
MGERTPHLDALARGGWIGVTAKHTRADLIRALIEGVSFSLKDCLDIVSTLGVEIESVRVSGGGAKSKFWRQLLADIFNKRVVTLETQEGSAYGAALLAMPQQPVIREVESVEPQKDYSKKHEIYKSLYPALKDFYRA